MAAQAPGRKEGCLRVAVVGLSGQSRADGGGVGKSCLCNRFVRHAEDNYSEQHVSTVTASDFYGPVINGQHYLYWGSARKSSASGGRYSSSPDLSAAVGAAAASASGGGGGRAAQGRSKRTPEFEVVEQTVFVDDSTLNPFGTGEGSITTYIRRVAKTKLNSAGKFTYLHRDQLEDIGVGGTKYKTDYFPSPFDVEAFVVAADVSRVVPDQSKWLERLLSTLSKLKRPLVVAACKCDIALPSCMEELESLVKRCAKGTAIVETSARDNVNVDAAFLALATAVRHNGKHAPFHGRVAEGYAAAHRAVLEERTGLMAQFVALLEREVRDFQVTWPRVEHLLKDREELQRLVASVGRDAVRRVVIGHAKTLKEQQRQEQLAVYSQMMVYAFEALLPGVTDYLPYEDAMAIVKEHSAVSVYFAELESSWDSKDGLANTPSRNRVPFQLLDTKHGRSAYEAHLEKIILAKQTASEAAALRSILDSCKEELVPGMSWSSVASVLRNKSPSGGGELNFKESVRQQVFAQFDADLRQEAFQEYRECLLESLEVLDSAPHSGSTPSTEQLKRIEQAFKTMPPYERLRKCVNERSFVLMNMLSEKQRPSLHEDIIRLISQLPPASDLLADGRHWALCPKDKAMSTILIGEPAITEQIVDAVKTSVRRGELPANQLPRTMVCLSPGEALSHLVPNSSSVGQPHGLVAVFANESSWNDLEATLTELLLSDDSSSSSGSQQPPYRGVPIVVVQIRDTSMTLPGRKKLKRRISSMLARLQCCLVKVTCCPEHASFSQYAASAVVMLRSAVDRRHSALTCCSDQQIAKEDITIALCCLSDDTVNAGQILSSLLGHQLCWKAPVRSTGNATEAFRVLACIDNRIKLVQIRLFSTLNAEFVRRNPHHGYIILHSSERLASAHIAHMLALHLPRVVPRLMVGRTNGFDEASEVELDILAATDQVASDSKSMVLLASPDFDTLDSPFKTFIETVWDKREESMTKQGVVLGKSRSDKTLKLSDQLRTLEDGQQPKQATLRNPYSLVGGLGGMRTKSESNLPKAGQSKLSASGVSPATNRSLTPDPGMLGGKMADARRRLSGSPLGNGESGPTIAVHGHFHPYDDVSPGASPQFRPRRDHPVMSSASPSGDTSRSPSRPDSRSPHSRPHPVPPPPATSSRVGRLRASPPRPSSVPEKSEAREWWRKSPEQQGTPPTSSATDNAPSRNPPRRWTGGDKRPPVLPKPAKKAGARSPELSAATAVRPSSLASMDKDSGHSSENLEFSDQHFSENVLGPRVGPPKLQRGQALSARSPIVRQKYMFSPVKDEEGTHQYMPRASGTAVYDNVVLPRGRPPQPPLENSQQQRLEETDHRWYLDASSDVSTTSTPPSRRSIRPAASDSAVYDDASENSDVRQQSSPPPRKESRYARPLANGVAAGQSEQFASATNHVALDAEEAPPVPPRGYLSENEGSETDDLLERLKQQRNSDSSTSSDDEAPPPLPTRGYLFDTEDSDDNYEIVKSIEGSTIGKGPSATEWKSILRLQRSRSSMHSELLSKHERKEVLKERRRRQKNEQKELREQQKRERDQRRKLEKERQKEERAKKKKEKAKRGGEVKPYRLDGPGPGDTYFGVFLHDLPKREDNSVIPLFVEMCINFLEEHGLSASGIYRVSGKKHQVDLLQEEFAEDPAGTALDPETVGVATVASALKSFFRRLPEPLVPTPIIGPLTKALNGASDLGQQLESIRMLINAGVPSIQLTILKYLCGHLYRLSQNHKANLMTPSNLSIVFWPTLMRPESLDLKDFTVDQELPLTLQRLMSLVIEHYPLVFGGQLKISPSPGKESVAGDDSDGVQKQGFSPYVSVSVSLTPIPTKKSA